MTPVKSPQAKLLALPQADWQKPHTYDSLLIVNAKRLHDSGWQTMVIVGCGFDNNKAVAIERVAYCDDINIILRPGVDSHALRMDMTPYSVTHLWSRYANFRIPTGQCSSCDIELIPQEP